MSSLDNPIGTNQINARKNINYAKVNPYDSVTDFATIDTAYNSSALMHDFQNKLSNDVTQTNNSSNINKNLQSLMNDSNISPDSEELINYNADQMVGALYDTKQSPPKSIQQLKPSDPIPIQIYAVQQPDSACKFFLLVLLIVVLVYGIYILYQQK